MKPSIGRIVHYVTPCGIHLPAIIVTVTGLRAGFGVSLNVFQHPNQPLALGQLGMVEHDEKTFAPGSWHWPEREE